MSSMPTYKDIDYTLVRAPRKTASILVERDGSVSVRVPEALTDAEVEHLIEGKRYWIYKHLAQWRDLNAAQVEREFVNGETFVYLGRNYRLRWVDDQDEPLVLKGDYFLLRRDARTQAAPLEAFKAFYREQGRAVIGERARYFAPQLDVQPNEVRVMELQHRWASCSAKRNINFNWRCMMAPMAVLDYIVVHELAHLRYSKHTEAFWNEIDKVMPDYKERMGWLRLNGASMAI